MLQLGHRFSTCSAFLLEGRSAQSLRILRRESGKFPMSRPGRILILDLSGEGNYMFKQSSKIPLKCGGQFLILAVVCLLFAAASVTAQYKGYRSVFKTTTDISKDAVLLANPAYDIDQCANLNPSCNWINGELGHQNSSYSEDDSVPFRAKMTNLTAGQTYSYTINWDATDNPTPNHGYDYLTTYNRTVAGADVCAGVTNCPATSSFFAIPTDLL